LNITIRLEEEQDYFQTENMTREAFWDLFQPGCDEHLVLHQLRQSAAFVPELDFVACAGDEIVGGIVYSRAVVSNGQAQHTVLCMGPLGVLPAYQRKGIGARLLQTSLQKARELGYAGVVIFGDPAYYQRFGFRNAADFGIQTSDGGNMEAFMALELQEGALDGISGRFHEDSAFQVTPRHPKHSTASSHTRKNTSGKANSGALHR